MVMDLEEIVLDLVRRVEALESPGNPDTAEPRFATPATWLGVKPHMRCRVRPPGTVQRRLGRVFSVIAVTTGGSADVILDGESLSITVYDLADIEVEAA